MTALIFFLLAIAMIMAVGGLRGPAIGLFAVSFVLAVLWFNHHLTDALASLDLALTDALKLAF